MSGSHVFILAIIAMALGYGLIKAWIRTPPSEVPDSDGNADEMLEKIDRLEERIRVLERIITDGNYELRKELDDL